MNNKIKLLSTLCIGFLCASLFIQCGESGKKVADKTEEIADKAEEMADKTGDAAKEMSDDAAKTAEDLAGMDAKEGTLSFEKGSWSYNVLKGLTSGNTIEFTLDQIPYEEGKDLTDAGKAQLDDLAAILKANPDWIIEVQGHSEEADNVVGTKAKKVSTKARASWVQAKLNLRGITGKQISSKGYGSEKLLEGLEPKDEQHRRITIALTKSEAA